MKEHRLTGWYKPNLPSFFKKVNVGDVVLYHKDVVTFEQVAEAAVQAGVKISKVKDKENAVTIISV